MIPKLATNPRFLEDCKKYQTRIDAVRDQGNKSALEKLLRQLIEQVNYIDRSHDQIILTGRMGDDISDIRSNIVSIKKTLDTKLDQIERSNFSVKPALRPNEE
jgi:DNA-binding SARP family transcriptional activator